MSQPLEITLPDRLKQLPPYLFAELDRVKREAITRGLDVINLGIGDPDLASPDFVVAELKRAAELIDNHHYPSYDGTPTFRKAAATWMRERFGVDLDPNREVLAMMGSKDGIAHLPLALINPGDTVVVPDPGYPVYKVATQFVGGKVAILPLTREHGFLPDLQQLEAICKKERPKLLFLNYPNNPTAAVAPLEFFADVVKMCRQHQVIFCHDNAYSELYYDGVASPSVLQVPGAKDVAIEMHSLSKSYNMTGWRIGFAVGHPQVLAALGKVKTNIDSGVFQAVQDASCVALQKGESFLKKQRQIFQDRRDQIASAMQQAGFQFKRPASTFYFWVDAPKGTNALAFCQRSIQEVGVVITPGVGFGQHGENYFRFTITAPVERLLEAAERLKKLL